MKKKGIAALLAAVMIITSFSVPTFAWYDVENSTYTYRDTTNLEVDVDAGTENIVLTWPAVDKEGNILNANPLRADGQINSNGNPVRGWTNPSNGMIIEYTGWLPDGSHNKVSNDNKADHNVLMGLVDYPTEYPVAVVDPKASDVTTSADAVKVAYIDTSVVATSFATAYQIQYSTDGITWKSDHITSTFAHGKKLTRITQTENTETGAIEEKLAGDRANTFFLANQLTEPLTNTLEPDTKYYIRVNAYDASTPTTIKAPFRTFQCEFTTPKAKVKTPAFATVEGSGKYSQGGRGGDVYVVTNLTDSVTDPQPGSLRYGLLRLDRADKNALAPRTIVFDIGGTIHIDETAAKSARRMNITSNTTILGQTAPGEGITIAGSSMKFNGDNIIVRYMRFRLGGGYDLDAATATGKYIVIDHCSFGWGVDEVFSAKEILNSSIQYNIMSSGLAVPSKNAANNTDPEIASGESEAKHGMGSIINGNEVSYTHNLWAHNGTRNPRFEGGFNYNGIRYENKLDFANNVIYDWGHNSTYGGERGNGQTNFVGNYYKPGPETIEKVKYQFVDCDSSSYKSSYYIDGNVMTSSDEVTANNALGFRDMASGAATQLTSKVALNEEYIPTSAETAYSEVLNSVGASKMRDPQDNRLIYEVTYGKGGFINDQAEAGGFDNATFASEITDSDSDGLPDEFETQNGLNPGDASDSCKVIEDETSKYNGYSYIEVYAGELVDDWGTEAEPPVYEGVIPHGYITGILDENGTNVMAPKGNTILSSGKAYTVEMLEPIDSVVYLNDKQVSDNTLKFTAGEPGVYNLSCLQGNVGHNRAFTVAVPVTVVKGEGNIDGFSTAFIGEKTGAYSTDRYDAEAGILYTQGSGRIGITKTTGTQNPDSFHYNYKKVTGDFEFVAKMDNLAKIDYLQKSGIMVRSSLDPSAELYMAALTYLKGEDYDGGTDVTGQSVKAKNIAAFARTTNGGNVAQLRFMGVPIVKQGQTPNKGYGKLTRSGNSVTISSSLDGENWYTLWQFENTTLPETCYIGFATSAAQDLSDKVRSNVTAFSDISINATDAKSMLGDANCDGTITASDAALTLQYVLDEGTNVSSEGQQNMLVIDSETMTAQNAAHILQKALSDSYVFPVENVNG